MIQSHSAHDLLSVPGSSDTDRKRSGKTLARPSSPLLRAKNAFRRTFSNGGDKNVLQRGTDKIYSRKQHNRVY